MQADTVVVIAASGLEQAQAIGVIILVFAVVVMVTLISLFLWRTHKLAQALQSRLRDMNHRLEPLISSAEGVARNLDYVTDVVRSDIQKLNASVADVGARLRTASQHMEERVEEFNALLECVQEEAEATFIDTAARVRGIRAGARALQRPSREPGDAQAPLEHEEE